MAIKRACLGCGRKITTGSRCASCQSIYEQAREDQAPWRLLYATHEYQTARAAVMRRADGRCEHAELHRDMEIRCPAQATGVHHKAKLSSIWDATDNPEAFMREAVRLDRLVALCRPHHQVWEKRAV